MADVGHTAETYTANLVSLFEAQVERTPAKLAVVENDKSLTYGELNVAAAHLAAQLESSSNSIVAVLLPQGIDFLVCTLAVLKSGRTISPLSTDSTTIQLTAMLNQLGAPFLISTEDVLNQCGFTEYKNLIKLPLKKSSNHRTFKAEATSNPAYCIFTSGSTGEPKGVLVNHSAYLNVTNYLIEALSITEADRCLLFASPAFDVSIAEIWPVLSTGGTLIAPPLHFRYAVNLLKNFVYEHEITHCFLTTYIGVKFLKFCSESDQVSKIKCVTLAGEKLLNYPSGNFNFQIFNFYGPTEAAVYATGCILKPEQAGVPPIGKPIANVFIKILDGKLQEVANGVIGEICIGGAGVGRGYLNSPELTNQKFVALSNGDRIYKSGDEGYIDSEGNVHCIGRMDHQVKIRGLRIELGNIEHVLMNFPEIDTAVVDVEPVNAEKQVIAYCKIKNGFQAADIFSFIHTRLSHYEQPAAIYAVDSIPLTSSGKIDRKQIRSLKSEQRRIRPGFEQPITDMERFVAIIWAGVLNMPEYQIGRSASFFAYGGNSVLAVQVLRIIEIKTKVALPIHTFFRYPKVMQLADAVQIELSKFKSQQGNITDLQPHQHSPLTRSQESIFRRILANPDKDEYSFSCQFAFNQQGVTPLIISEAVQVIVRRHPIFRYTFYVTEDGDLFQLKSVPESFLVPTQLHVSPETDDDPWNEATRILSEAADIHFDLAEGPLARFFVIPVSENCIKFEIVAHYLTMDLTALNDFIWELKQEVRASLGFQIQDIFKPRKEYSEFAIWQRQQAFQKETGFWKEYLKGAKGLVLRGDKNAREPLNIHPYYGFVFRFQIPPDVVRRLDEMARSQNTTHFILLLTAFKLLLHRYTNESDILVCSMTTGRHVGEFSDIVGNFVNPILIRTRFLGDIASSDFRSVLKLVHDSTIRVYENSQMPFQSVVENCVKNYSEAGLTNVCIQMLARTLTQVVSRVNNFNVHCGNQFNQDLIISFEDLGEDTIDGFVEANSFLFSKEYISKLIDDFLTILESLD